MVPFKWNVIAISRVKGSKEKFKDGKNVLSAWRCDGEDGEEPEIVVLSGWESVEKHSDFLKRRVEDSGFKVETVYAVNMES